MTLTVAEQRARLERMVEAFLDPTLSAVEVDDLMALSRVVDANGTAPDEYADWKAATTYVVGAYAVPVVRNDHYYRVTTGGTSGNAQPVFPTTSGATVTDGTVVWTESGRAAWEPTFDLNRGAAAGWEKKAGKVANAYGFSQADGESHQRQQRHEMMLNQARAFRRKISAAVSLRITDDTWPAVTASA